MYDVEYEVNQWIEKAYTMGASDLHITPTKEEVQIRFRLDGILEFMDAVSKEEGQRLVNRLKLMAGLDIGEHRIPQDGRLATQIEEEEAVLRMSTMATIYGENVVLRLQKKERSYTCTELGMSDEVIEEITKLMQRPYGLFLVTGPTGSGKSTTLYTLLEMIYTGKEHIITLENPVERELKGMTQVEIHPKGGITFAGGLRAALRQDPDSIMVGEIRDRETAELAVQAALTGHKVFSTIHTNTAAGVITRCIDMGIPEFLVKASLSGALAQRLVRRLCKYCHGKGCIHCRDKGFQGRIGLFELLVLPKDSTDWTDIEQYVHPSMAESARALLQSGETTIEELLRIGMDKKCLKIL